jgi:outer membrane protein
MPDFPTMKKIFLLALLGSFGTAQAQTLAANMMPDGSRDIFVGLAVAAGPRYEGADRRRTMLMPIVQMQWSNGIFVSDLYTVGMHLSSSPGVEYGPLLQYQPERRASDIEKNAGAEDIHATVNAGGFFNYELARNLRLKSSLLHASGNGLLFKLDLQQIYQRAAPHHTLSLSTGIIWANRQYTQKYFGIYPSLGTGGSDPTMIGPNPGGPSYTPAAGIKDVHLTANWNWEWNANWLLTSGASFVHLTGDAAASPLVGKRNYLAVHTGLAYRF